ncbi:hypothetical protein, partial [Bradyrhizobium brasilense]|uniref:hypothetical protein n=1 Tax=Bradyrhizobium brasilense TaxID=1419277 RepID=UPI001E5E4684
CARGPLRRLLRSRRLPLRRLDCHGRQLRLGEDIVRTNNRKHNDSRSSKPLRPNPPARHLFHAP